MNETIQSGSSSKATAKRGSLARSFALTLTLVSFIPLLLMSVAAWGRSYTLLRGQAETQMKTLVSGEVKASQNQVKIRQIRLDRIARRADFESAVNSLLHQSPSSPFFLESSRLIRGIFNELNREGASPIFTEFMIITPEGEVLLASQTDWQGKSVSNISLFEDLRSYDSQTVGTYDFAPFFPGQFVLLTVDQYRTSDGISRATVIGVSEEQSASAILESLSKLSPESSRAYYVTNYGGYIGLEPYTNALVPFVSSLEQRARVDSTLNPLKESEKQSTKVAVDSVEYVNEQGDRAIAQVAWIDELQAGLVLEVPTDAVFGELNSLLPFAFLVFGGLAAAIIFASFSVTNQITKPLLSLTDVAGRIARGELQERISIARNDEIGVLANSFNIMSDELNRLYTSLRGQVEERTRQIRTAAEVAQGITTAFDLHDLLQKTAQLIVERFSFYHTGVFLIDETGKFASLRAAHGPSAEEMLKRGHRHQVGSASIVGWVSANKKPRVASNVDLDPVHYRNELLPLTRAEVGIPIVLGGVVLGVLDVQSTEPETFDEEMIIVLQTLANQIAAAIQNTSVTEEEQVSSASADRIYRLAVTIAQASSENEAIEATSRAIREARHPFIILRTGIEESEILISSNPYADMKPNLPGTVFVSDHDIQVQLSGPLLVNDVNRDTNSPAELVKLLKLNGAQSGLILPVIVDGQTTHLLIVGEIPGQPLTSATVRPFISIPDVLSSTLARIKLLSDSQARISEMDALMTINRAILSTNDIQGFYAALQEQISRVVGDCSFLVALYDGKTNSIQIPFIYEEGRISSIETFPLGEGLTSILIRTRRPLLLVEDTERQAQALGAKIQGKPAKSWLGVPLLIGGEAIGALVIQDADTEKRFNDRDLNFMVDVSRQASGVIHNVRLLEQSRRTTLQLQTAAEIARDISGSLNLDELLLRAVNLIVERFRFYHASVFLIDPHGDFAAIREATGEAGAQLKRIGHKLGVGSKSIVGYVTGRGETLVVNDTMKDATYFANPLLPDTRSECAIPLKVGERVLGALDVQSATPFAFTEENLRTLEILADQLAVAVVNTELFADSQEHLSQHRLLHHITTSAASGTTLEEALETTVKGLQVTLGGDRVAILLANRDKRILETRASVGYSDDTSHITIRFDQGMTGWVATHRRPLRIDDVTNDPRYIEVSSNTRSELALPLLYRNELLGVLNVESEQIAAYTENDEEMLGTLAGSLAAVIANARLLDQIRRQAERERLLYDVTSKIRRSTDVQTILATTASEITKVIGAKGTQIRLTPPVIENANGRDE